MQNYLDDKIFLKTGIWFHLNCSVSFADCTSKFTIISILAYIFDDIFQSSCIVRKQTFLYMHSAGGQ